VIPTEKHQYCGYWWKKGVENPKDAQIAANNIYAHTQVIQPSAIAGQQHKFLYN